MRKTMLLVAMLTLALVAAVPALAQDDEGSDVFTTDVPMCALGPPDHVPGEFLVSYDSEEAMRAAPQENVVSTSDNSGWYYPDEGTVYYPTPTYMQTLYSEDVASIPDPCERFAAEEAKRKEILTWPGVKYAEYDGYMYTHQDAQPAE